MSQAIKILEIKTTEFPVNEALFGTPIMIFFLKTAQAFLHLLSISDNTTMNAVWTIGERTVSDRWVFVNAERKTVNDERTLTARWTEFERMLKIERFKDCTTYFVNTYRERKYAPNSVLTVRMPH